MKQRPVARRHHHLRRSWLAVVAVAVVLGAGAYGVARLRAATQTKQAAVPHQTTPTHQPRTATAQKPATPPPDTHCDGNTAGQLVLVSISRQHLWACDGTHLVNQTAVTTGSTVVTNGVDDNTPTGTWQIYSKQTDRHLTGCDANGCWNDPVQYWMPFDGAVGFHDASWQTFPFGASNYHTDGSHGCVHLPTDFVAWLYNWAPVGTTVTVEA